MLRYNWICVAVQEKQHCPEQDSLLFCSTTTFSQSFCKECVHVRFFFLLTKHRISILKTSTVQLSSARKTQCCESRQAASLMPLPLFFRRLDSTEAPRSQSELKVHRLELDVPSCWLPRASRPSQSGRRCAQLPPDRRDVRQGLGRMRTAGERRVNTGICMKEQEEGKPYKLSCADRKNGRRGGWWWQEGGRVERGGSHASSSWD